jgi:outer membrane biosynthesis protein TonB
VIVALTSISDDAKSWRGYDLVSPLTDTAKTVQQGLNGPIWALIAFDTAHYFPVSADIRAHYLDYIMDREKQDGGWDLLGQATGKADPDITGMALQALARYYKMDEADYDAWFAGTDAPTHAALAAAADKAVGALKDEFDANGGFTHDSEGQTSESAAQVLVALCAMEWPDADFIDAVAQNLLTFRNADGSFNHVNNSGGTGETQMSTEQAAYALVAYDRFKKNKNSLYDMTDIFTVPDPVTPDPDPDPVTPDPDPDPVTPDPDPDPDDPGTNPNPVRPTPSPSPSPSPSPDSDPTPEPAPAPDPSPTPDPDPEPDPITTDPALAEISAPAFTPPEGIEAAGGARPASASELEALGFEGLVSESSDGSVTIGGSSFTAGLNASSASTIDAEEPVTPLPAFRAGVSAGGSALITLKIRLDSYAGRTFGSVAVLKMKGDKSVDVLDGAAGRESVKPGEFVWTDAAGSLISRSDKIAAEGEYFLNVVITDGSGYDLDPEQGTIVDPLALSVAKTAPESAAADAAGSGGGGGCSAGATAWTAAFALALAAARGRGKPHKQE